MTSDADGTIAIGYSVLRNVTTGRYNTAVGYEALLTNIDGDILYYNGTDYARLGVGSSGQFLKTQGAGANPIWGSVSTAPSMGGD